MPEDAEREPLRRVLDRLDRPVFGMGGLDEPLSQPVETLVVMRFDRCALAQKALQPRVRYELDVVVAELAGRVLVVVVADELGQVLMEITAAGDVQDLATAADGEDRQVSLERSLEQCQLRPVALRHDAFGLGVRLLAVRLGIEIGAARQQQAVERLERLVDRLLGGRDQKRAAAGPLDGPNIGRRNERLLELPLTAGEPEPGSRDVGGDADDGAHCGRGYSTCAERRS